MGSNQSSSDQRELHLIDSVKVTESEQPGAFKLQDTTTIETGEIVRISKGRLWTACPDSHVKMDWPDSRVEMKFLDSERYAL